MAGVIRRPVWFWRRVFLFGGWLQRKAGPYVMTVTLKVDTSKFSRDIDEMRASLEN